MARWHQCECGRQIQNPYETLCASCKWRKELLPAVVKKLASGIDVRWVQSLFVEYCDLRIRAIKLPSQLPPLLRRDVRAFAEIAAAIPIRNEFTIQAIIERCGDDFHIRFRRVMNGLVTLGAVRHLEEEERGWLSQQRLFKRMLDTTKGTWRHKALSNFYERIMQRRSAYISKGHTRTNAPIKPQTIEEYVRFAHKLFETAAANGATSITGITQHHVDLHLSKAGRRAKSCGYVIRYLNERTHRFNKLKTSPAVANRFGRSCMREDRFNRLLFQLLHPNCARDLGFSLMCLLCLLYAQQPPKVLHCKLSDIRYLGQQWQYKPAAVWLDVPVQVGELMSRWIAKLDEVPAAIRGDWIFPGSIIGQPLKQSALYLWLIERKVLPRQLFPSAIANLIRNGVTETSVLRQAYGIPTASANAYLRALLPISEDRAMALLKAKSTHAR